MNNQKYYRVINIDRLRNLIYIKSHDAGTDIDLSSVFRQIEGSHNRADTSKPWRVIYNTPQGSWVEVKLDFTSWPRSYRLWDRRYNPNVVTEPWYGVEWDILKNAA